MCCYFYTFQQQNSEWFRKHPSWPVFIHSWWPSKLIMVKYCAQTMKVLIMSNEIKPLKLLLFVRKYHCLKQFLNIYAMIIIKEFGSKSDNCSIKILNYPCHKEHGYNYKQWCN